MLQTQLTERLPKQSQVALSLLDRILRHQLEQLLNFALLPRQTPITLDVLSDEICQRIQEHYPHLRSDFPAFSTLTLEQIRKAPDSLKKKRILLAHKLICEEHADLFRNIPRVIAFNRFQDDGGLNYIRNLRATDTREKHP